MSSHRGNEEVGMSRQVSPPLHYPVLTVGDLGTKELFGMSSRWKLGMMSVVCIVLVVVFGLVCVLCVSVCCSVFVCDCAVNVNVWIVIAFVVMCLFVGTQVNVCKDTKESMM